MTTSCDYSTRSPSEAKTHELLDLEARGLEWTQGRQIVANVFKARHWGCFPVEQIAAIGCALEGVENFDASGALEYLRKAKVLRARNIRGVRHYEVNY